MSRNMYSYSSNIYKEYASRYEFASKFVSGKVLDFASNSHMAYYGAKTLLNLGATEVIRCNILDETNECTRRKIGSDNSIEFNIINNVIFQDKSFDCIVSFETLQHVQNYKDKIKDFSRLLKDDGLLIVSVPNKDVYAVKTQSNSQINKKGFTKDELVQVLESPFKKIALYSQRLMTKKEVLETTFPSTKLFPRLLYSSVNIPKKIIRSLLLRIDKNLNFFQLHFEKTYLRLSKMGNNVANITNKKEYVPLPYQSTHRPLFFVAICYKKTSQLKQ